MHMCMCMCMHMSHVHAHVHVHVHVHVANRLKPKQTTYNMDTRKGGRCSLAAPGASQMRQHASPRGHCLHGNMLVLHSRRAATILDVSRRSLRIVARARNRVVPSLVAAHDLHLVPQHAQED